MSVAQTSLFAYRSLNNLGDRQRRVFGKLRELGRATNEELAAALDWPINTITPRVGELRRFGYVTPDGTKLSKSGRPAKVWVICDPQDRKAKQLLREA